MRSKSKNINPDGAFDPKAQGFSAISAAQASNLRKGHMYIEATLDLLIKCQANSNEANLDTKKEINLIKTIVDQLTATGDMLALKEQHFTLNFMKVIARYREHREFAGKCFDLLHMARRTSNTISRQVLSVMQGNAQPSGDVDCDDNETVPENAAVCMTAADILLNNSNGHMAAADATEDGVSNNDLADDDEVSGRDSGGENPLSPEASQHEIELAMRAYRLAQETQAENSSARAGQTFINVLIGGSNMFVEGSVGPSINTINIGGSHNSGGILQSTTNSLPPQSPS